MAKNGFDVTIEESNEDENDIQIKVTYKKNGIFSPPIPIEQRKLDERPATWLELFYDLFYVAVISKASESEVGTWEGVGRFVALFIPIWWAWASVSFYATRYDSDDVLHRILIFIQMFGIVGLAVTVEAGDAEGAVGFILSFILIRACLMIQYSIAAIFHADTRKHLLYYVAANAFSAICFGASLAIELPYRYILWYSSLGIEWILDFRKFKKIPFHGSHLPERFGLFTLIVLGEAVLQIVNSITELQYYTSTSAWVLTGMALASTFCLWWIYFHDFTGQVVSITSKLSATWLYFHLPLHMFFALLGGLLRIVLSAHEDLVDEETVRVFLTTNFLLFLVNATLKGFLSRFEYLSETQQQKQTNLAAESESESSEAETNNHHHGHKTPHHKRMLKSRGKKKQKRQRNHSTIKTAFYMFSAIEAVSRFLISIIFLFCFLIPSDEVTPTVLIGVLLACSLTQVVVDITLQVVEFSYAQKWEAMAEEAWANEVAGLKE